MLKGIIQTQTLSFNFFTKFQFSGFSAFPLQTKSLFPKCYVNRVPVSQITHTWSFCHPEFTKECAGSKKGIRNWMVFPNIWFCSGTATSFLGKRELDVCFYKNNSPRNTAQTPLYFYSAIYGQGNGSSFKKKKSMGKWNGSMQGFLIKKNSQTPPMRSVIKFVFKSLKIPLHICIAQIDL